MTEPRGDRTLRSREWFREWFGEDYLALYPHRDEEEALAGVRLYLASVPPKGGAGVLDVACGAGRHLRALEGAGVSAIGLDLSMVLLRRAYQGGTGRLVCGDMRSLPFAAGSFGGVTSFFTSFGYFVGPEDDRRALLELRRVLRPGGSFILDFLNAERVRRDLVEEDVRRVEGHTVTQRRSIEGDAVVKRIHIESTGGRPPRTYEERVRLYSASELLALLASCGLSASHRFGDYEGEAFGADAPRLILAGRTA